MSLDSGYRVDVVTSRGGMSHPIQNLVGMWRLVTLHTPRSYENVHYSGNEAFWKDRECFQPDQKWFEKAGNEDWLGVLR